MSHQQLIIKSVRKCFEERDGSVTPFGVEVNHHMPFGLYDRGDTMVIIASTGERKEGRTYSDSV
jgi:hypothetical protein